VGENRPNTPAALSLARLIGLAGAVLTLVLYGVLLFANPYSGQGIGEDTYVVATAMGLLAPLVIWAALTLKPLVILGAFVVSFFPVGLYTLGTPGLFRWIGVANLLYLVSGIGIWLCRGSRPQS
jgi:hypothetical protein